MTLRNLALMVALVFVAISSSAQADVQKFNYPKNGSYRLDWCYKFQNSCGARAARQYCIRKGFDDQIGFRIDEDIGEETPTRTLQDKQVCDEEYCDGFRYITCERAEEDEDEEDVEPVYIKKTFLKPKAGALRVNYCFRPNSGCGKKAADAFCDISGYDNAISFIQSPPLGLKKTTVFLGTGQACPGFCPGFAEITCRKQQ